MVEELTKEIFLEKIYDSFEGEELKYKGERPAIIDFYTEWCGPCKTLSPILEELSKEYEGKVDIYKVNIDEQRELAEAFGIMSVPSLLFIPLNKKPQMVRGAIPKSEFEKHIGKWFK